MGDEGLMASGLGFRDLGSESRVELDLKPGPKDPTPFVVRVATGTWEALTGS